jgi:hypothetical protein
LTEGASWFTAKSDIASGPHFLSASQNQTSVSNDSGLLGLAEKKSTVGLPPAQP